MEAFTQAVSAVSDFLWNNLLLFLLCGTGIFFTIRLGFVQVRKFGAGVKNLFGGFSLHGKAAGKDGMSSFQALTTAVAAQVAPATSPAAPPRWHPAGRGHLLDVGVGLFRHGHHLRRGHSGPDL